ncbi:hypothetical protein FE257_005002 [Aspergillus nanangensis]|uniref:AMP-dependent synthetase/ligase domain-containing protein n=1 Tax=Aspergillus nanangensis TaxID=2582783 RepID=A0AAD4CRE9_ASPNN|nr:hypothetical protein FE257_005002 [Aspergillus nanangensis]
MTMSKPIWQPVIPADQIPMNIYRAHINQKYHQNLTSSHALHQWSVTHPQDFWLDLHQYTGIVPPLPPTVTRAYDAHLPIDQIPKFFDGAVVNYAENVFHDKVLSRTALVGIRENQSLAGEVWTWARLREVVRQLRSAMLRSGVCPGDRVGAIISTSVWSVALFLAAASIGAIWTSIAPDIGVEGCVSRLDQVHPRILFADSASTFKGKSHSNIAKVQRIASRLTSSPEVFLIPMGENSTTTTTTTTTNTTVSESAFPSLETFLSRSLPSDALHFARLPYSHPLYILYTSGTTGPPKCLVHSHSVILQHKKVSQLHNSLSAEDIVFQYSSTSWVLWNIMVGHLAVGAQLVLYDGSPLWPSPTAMLKILAYHRVTYWGVSPRYLQQLEMAIASGGGPQKVELLEGVDLSALKMVQTGGAHLAADQYRWFYRVFPSRVHLTSVTGGTDLVTSWVGTDPAGPLYPGEIQLPMLGQDVDVAHPVTGESVRESGQQGEFVCRAPFPSMPVFFWGDTRDMVKYKEAYFGMFPGCWAQRDWASYNPVTRGWVIHGRSDGVLNPQGIRFGSSDIYSIVEAHPFNEVISTTVCVGRRIGSDETVFLFVVMQKPHQLTDGLVQRLKATIKEGLSSRHVPQYIVEVPEVPMTVNGKKIETLVKQIVSTGKVPETVSNTVENPGCLSYFQQFYSMERSSRL